MLLRIASTFLLLGTAAIGQPLPGTAPLETGGDLALQMVDGMKRWLSQEAPREIPHRPPSTDRLRYILGVVDPRVPYDDLELVAGLRQPAERARTGAYTVRAVRWPVLAGVHAEGLFFDPTRAPAGRIVLLGDAGEAPEQSRYAQRLAAAGYQVLAPILIDRADTWSGIPAFRMTNQPHREFLYRMGFPVGRHILGYEVQKVLAAVDWFARQPGALPIAVSGTGEGGVVAFYAGALDARIGVTEVEGYFGRRSDIAQQPVYRNVWTLQRDFGDAEVAMLYGSRRLVVHPGGPRVDGPPPARDGRQGAAPGRLVPVTGAEIASEIARAQKVGARVELLEGRSAFGTRADNGSFAPIPVVDADGRLHRQFDELVDYTQHLVRAAHSERDRWWKAADRSSPENWLASAGPYRERILDDVIGKLPAPRLPANPRTRLAYHGDNWDGYDVVLDLYPDVFAYGVLLVPKARPAGGRLPLVFAQHGLNGRPQHLFGQAPDGKPGTPFGYYQNIGSHLADLGYVVFLPQNPYIGDFRPVVRLSHPWGLTLYSFIQAQNRRALDWLTTLDFVDPKRVGYYGLSYGGKTALRIPPFDERFALSICSGDFNEWVVKLATVEEPFSYLFTQEYEMSEWNLGHIANHAELASLMAPRPFMVERGHRDGVGVDEWVSYEYARVRRLYDEMGIGDRTAIEFFNGPHQIHGVGTIEFLRRWL